MNFHHENIIIKFDSCKETIRKLLSSIGSNFIDVLRILICESKKNPYDYFYSTFYTYVKSIYILNIHEWFDICYDKIEYLLLIQTNEGWKYINIRDNVTLKRNEVFEVHSVKILKNTCDKLIFMVGSKETCEFYHCYERIGRNDAIYFYKYRNWQFHDFPCFPETGSRLISIMNSKCQKHILFITNDKTSTPNEQFSTSCLNAKYVRIICFGNDIKEEHLIQRHRYPNNDIFFESLATFIYNGIDGELTYVYSKFLLCIYNIFLPVIRLARMENILMMGEADLISNVIDILREENKSELEPLPILLLRAVVYEHSLMLFRKIEK